METITLDSDIRTFYVTADSFPQGIAKAHEKLHEMVPSSPERKYFGISRPENGTIVYRAAAEEINKGEAEKLNCETLVLKGGRYVSLAINDYTKDLLSIDRAFKTLLQRSDLDPNGYCVEWYLDNRNMKCMIRLKE